MGQSTGPGDDPANEGRPRPSFSAAVSNWRAYDAPLFTKLRMAFVNSAAKLRTRSDCCGHAGQPGC